MNPNPEEKEFRTARLKRSVFMIRRQVRVNPKPKLNTLAVLAGVRQTPAGLTY